MFFFQFCFLLFFLANSLSHATEPRNQRELHYQIKNETSEVRFKAIGKPSALKILGKGKALNCRFFLEDGFVKGQCALKVNSLDTGIALRDKHLEKYLEANQFPSTTFVLTGIELPKVALINQGGPSEKLPFQGKLTLHGVEKEIRGQFTFHSQTTHTEIAAEFRITLTDYNIQIPSFMGITVANEVQLQVQLDLVQATTP